MKKMNPSDFEKACICAIEAAAKNKLFYSCEQGVVEDFLKSFWLFISYSTFRCYEVQ